MEKVLYQLRTFMSKGYVACMAACAMLLMLMGCNEDMCNDRDKEAEMQEWVIIDTDIASSTDDIIAMGILYRATDMGKVQLKAIMISREGEDNARFADIMNTYYQHPEIPIGVARDGVKNPEVFIDYWKMVHPEIYTDEPRFPTTLTDSEIAQLPDAVKLYRKILSQAPDSSVKIVSIGFATNLARLLLSKADEYSPLDGVELVSKKVKALYQQGGSFGDNPLPDYNFLMDKENARKLISKWPSAIYYSPMESGQEYSYLKEELLTDLMVANRKDSPLYHIYEHHEVNDDQRMWDALTALQLMAPEIFRCEGPFDSSLDADMILRLTPNPAGKHFVQVPPASDQEKEEVMQHLRDWIKAYRK